MGGSRCFLEPSHFAPCNAKAAIGTPLSCSPIKPIYCVKGWLWGEKWGFVGYFCGVFWFFFFCLLI